MTPGEQRVVDRTRAVLRERFPLYAENHLVYAMQIAEKGSVRTLLHYRRENKPFVTSMNVQWEGERAYILTFFIDEFQKGKGYGRMLYEVAKALCAEHGCTHIRTTPSGDGVGFWPKMGFQPCGSEFELEARI
jgi:GNAT superfamily N-acetyltransferase